MVWDCGQNYIWAIGGEFFSDDGKAVSLALKTRDVPPGNVD